MLFILYINSQSLVEIFEVIIYIFYTKIIAKYIQKVLLNSQ